MRPTPPALLACVLLTACSGEAPPPPPPPPATVSIDVPTAGLVSAADSLRVRLSSSSIEIVPADGEPTPGRAHHHLFLDMDVTPPGEPIPKQVQGITHLVTGAAEFTLKRLSPGQHRLIAVLALGDHVPLEPSAVDTVFFTVEEPAE